MYFLSFNYEWSEDRYDKHTGSIKEQLFLSFDVRQWLEKWVTSLGLKIRHHL